MPILVKDLTYVYDEDGPWRAAAVREVNLEIGDGEFLALIGPTGSGKSTLVQHFNGLLRPTSGEVIVDGINLARDRNARRLVRQKVGLVFQYPEHQLFEETVYADVAFGPRNLGLEGSALEERVWEALAMVGLPRELANRSPFELSGGQMRRAAIAGVLAMKPRVLVLDEPTAGLDPNGRREIMERVCSLHRETGLTVILVSHNMEDVARFATRVAVMEAGRLILSGSPAAVFGQGTVLRRLGLGVPQVTRLMEGLAARGIPAPAGVLTVGEAQKELLKLLGRKKKRPGDRLN